VPVTVDITDRTAIVALAAQASDVNLLINNAGVVTFGGILDVPDDTLEATFRTNFYGSLAMARAFVPVIERRGGGAIVNVLTMLALASMPSMSAYNASKAAAWSATQSLRAALRDRGIAVHAVFPSAVDTEMLASVDTIKVSPQEVATGIVAGIADGREDIFPDAMSVKSYAAWLKDHKQMERRFARL
jgi:short-subunit dehydrogenase